ncbi:unnamed protein product [Parnassius apollo]|uniref:(apollo) hypothetical protein n=1 Tax=Parnassius apollo TaxID=110799 RepID=A0A8S3XBZ2_PARAO|nr:unnamed protein product [Parnassius apollo]
MYRNSDSIVRTAVGDTTPFPITLGVNQGSVLSPYLFSVILDELSASVQKLPQPWLLIYADDIALVDGDKGRLTRRVHAWREALENGGLKLNVAKMEYMACNSTDLTSLRIGDDTEECTDNFRIKMCDRFKDSRGKKLLQLLNSESDENKENCDRNLIKEDSEEIVHNNIPKDDNTKECFKNSDNVTTFEAWKEAEPIAHCSYNPPENKSSFTEPPPAAYESYSEDDDDSVKDPHYKSSSSSRSSSSSSSSSSTSTSTAITNNVQVLPTNGQVEPVSIQTSAETNNEEIQEAVQNENESINQDEIVDQNISMNEIEENSNVKKSRKRVARVEEWLSNKAKKLRNTGKCYISRFKTKKIIPARSLKPPCVDKCKMQCSTKIDEDCRKKIFAKYWGLGDITLQRNFINSSTKAIVPAFRFSGKEKPRGYNNAYYFDVDNEKIRVCKKFFMNTLDVNDRVIRTVFQKRDLGFIDIEKRGKHGNHKKVDESIKQAVRDHINSIPRIESHYIRKDSSREYIDGGKCLADLHADYKAQCLEQGVSAAHYEMYAKIFNYEFNISFFTPKKDRCELCVSYENATGSAKEELQEKYMLHQEEKDLSRIEKESDKNKACNDYVMPFRLAKVDSQLNELCSILREAKQYGGIRDFS